MSHTLEYDRMPSALAGFARAAVARGSGLKEGESVPRITARCRGVVADEKVLRKYRSLCNFRNDGRLPVTFPHILAAPLHLQLLTHPAFPFKLLGAVHVRNSITQHRGIAASEVVDIEVWVEGQRRVDAGYEFDIEARVTDTMGQLAWQSTSTMLIRQKHSQSKKEKSGWTPPDWNRFRLVESWKAPEDIGRRYGVVAGDVNPIHMHKLTAKAFGFKRAIAHGMWSYARCAGRLVPSGAEAVTVTAAFKRPVFLPSKVELLAQDTASGCEYLLTNAARDVVYLEGRCEAADGSSAEKAPNSAAAPAPARKAGARKATAKKTAARKSAPKKAGAREASAKKAGAKKASTKKASTKKASARKAGAKSAGKKSAARKTAAKKASS